MMGKMRFFSFYEENKDIRREKSSIKKEMRLHMKEEKEQKEP